MEKIKTWIKLDDLFIDEENIRAIQKNGKKTVIERIQGNNIVVDIEFEKVKLLIKEP
ncbi:MAG: hypothetical protein KDD29_06550 [Flavobacteriales bacterium]|nr:hypothetical protein [Flavobacteriales bacterium]MCB9335760.1 hypothetical protein [Flavobacteriales bacterium]